MAALLHLFLLSLLITPHLSLSEISLPPSPSPSLSPPSDFAPSPSLSASDLAPSPSLSIPNPPSLPPSPSPSPSIPLTSPSPSPSPSPAPAPAQHEELKAGTDSNIGEGDEERGEKGLNGGKKAGVVVGVFAAAAAVGLAVVVCKKRRDNIQRSRYSGYASRVEMV